MEDLRQRPPRSVRERLAGYVHLGRMLDKCRATLAGTQGDYIYPCPLDRRLLEFVELTAEQFAEAARHRSDQEVVDWFLATARRRDEAEIERWNESMLGLGPDSDEKWTYFRSCRNTVAPERSDITTWADLLDLEEGRSVPQRNAPARGRA